MFAKYWEPGKVKTRLASEIGAERAATIHKLFVEVLARRFAAVGDRRVLSFSPPGCEETMREVAAGAWRLEPQAAGDLGERMRTFFETSVSGGSRVVLIGSDSPDMPLEYVHEAFEALATHDVVLGRADDGGYYLLGMAGQVAPIFSGIAWSTPDVWAQTTAILESKHTSWHSLPPWYDVDNLSSLKILLANLKTQVPTDPHLARLQADLESLAPSP